MFSSPKLVMEILKIQISHFHDFLKRKAIYKRCAEAFSDLINFYFFIPELLSFHDFLKRYFLYRCFITMLFDFMRFFLLAIEDVFFFLDIFVRLTVSSFKFVGPITTLVVYYFIFEFFQFFPFYSPVVFSLLTFVGIFFILGAATSERVRFYALDTAVGVFLSSLFWFRDFCLLVPETGGFLFNRSFPFFGFLNVNFHVAVNSISILFVLLSTFLIFLCILSSWNFPSFRRKEYFISFLLIDFFLIQVFIQQNLFFFFIFFEAILVPMFFVIGVWGSRVERIGAAYRFFMYTFIGSTFMLFGMAYLLSRLGTLDWFELIELRGLLSVTEQTFLWFLFFVAFSVKIPLFPFHTWLPEAHVEAPTAGSMLLAGILLKMGGWGFLHFLLPLFPRGTVTLGLFASLLALFSVLYGSMAALSHVDAKKIIAYSSVAHMGYAVLGLLSLTIFGVGGGFFVMFSHGFVSTGLFFSIGVLYERYATRNVYHYGALLYFYPIFSCCFFLLALANAGIPGTSSFVGEIMVLIGLVGVAPVLALFSTFGIFSSVVYSLWLFGRISYVSEVGDSASFLTYADLNKREFFIFVFLLVPIVFGGVYPSFILDFIKCDVSLYLSLSLGL